MSPVQPFSARLPLAVVCVGFLPSAKAAAAAFTERKRACSHGGCSSTDAKQGAHTTSVCFEDEQGSKGNLRSFTNIFLCVSKLKGNNLLFMDKENP